jgi:hypothetical protein
VGNRCDIIAGVVRRTNAEQGETADFLGAERSHADTVTHGGVYRNGVH